MTIAMEVVGNNNEAINDNEDISPVKKVDEPSKKEPDEEEPSLLGTPPDLLKVLPTIEEDKDFSHLKDKEGLLDEEGKVDDGLI